MRWSAGYGSEVGGARGGAIQEEPWGRYAMFHDPDGDRRMSRRTRGVHQPGPVIS